MLWKVSERLEDFQELATALHATTLGATWRRRTPTSR